MQVLTCLLMYQHLSTGLYSEDAFYAGYCITFNAVSFDRVIQHWILSLTIYIMNSWYEYDDIVVITRVQGEAE